MSKIDRNRGVLIRMAPEGYRVVMYIDTPGIYFDAKGVRLDDTIAKAAGFDVASDRKQLAKNKLRSNYERQIGAKFAAMEQQMDAMLETNPNMVEEMEVKEVTPGMWAVMVGDVAISDTRLTQEEAVTLYTGLTGDDYTQDAEDTPPQKNPYADMTPKEIRALLKEAGVDVPTGLRMPKLAIFAFENVPHETDGDNASDLL